MVPRKYLSSLASDSRGRFLFFLKESKLLKLESRSLRRVRCKKRFQGGVFVVNCGGMIRYRLLIAE